MTLCLKSFQAHFFRLTDRRHVVVGYSGGVDSHVLLHLLSQIKVIQVKAVYVNHGLHQDAGRWGTHCAAVCADLNIPFETVSIEIIKKPRHSLEALAREQRYLALAKQIDAQTALLTAQHENDQAETVLLQLMRGAGVKGLSGMPAVKQFGAGLQVRPLLNMPREEIEAYARRHHLSWIEDSSNQQLDFDRNFLRHKILPELISRRQGVLANIVRTASHMNEAASLLDEYAALDFDRVKTDDHNRILIAPLKTLSDARQSQVIRYWLLQHPQQLRLPSLAILSQIKQQLVVADYHPDATVAWSHIILTHDREYLILSI